MDKRTEIEIESEVLRRLLEHLRGRSDVQNIDLMNMAGFCRNCLSKWYRAAYQERGGEMTVEEARELVYGMPFADWKAQYQTEASAEKLAEFEKNRPRDE